MEVQSTRTSEARPKRKENKTRPEPRKHTKDPTLAPLFSALGDFFEFFGLHQRVPLSIFFIFCNQLEFHKA